MRVIRRCRVTDEPRDAYLVAGPVVAVADSHDLAVGLKHDGVRCVVRAGQRLCDVATGKRLRAVSQHDSYPRALSPDASLSVWTQRLRPKDSEVMRLVCDASKLRQRTGWQPRCSRDEGLRRTIEWFRAPGNLERYNPSEYSQ